MTVIQKKIYEVAFPSIHSFIYNLTALIRKANATRGSGIDVGELIGYLGLVGKLCACTYPSANPGYAKRISVEK